MVCETHRVIVVLSAMGHIIDEKIPVHFTLDGDILLIFYGAVPIRINS